MSMPVAPIRARRTPLVALVLLLMGLAVSRSAGAPAEHWVATWGASPAPLLKTDVEIMAARLLFDRQTIREVIHTSIGGRALRVRLSNAYGREAIRIGSAHVALAAGGAGVVPGTDRTLTFGGSPEASLPPDATLLSDPVALDVPGDANLAISLFLPYAEAASGIHYSASQTAYVCAGDRAASAAFAPAGTLTSWVFLGGVEVLAPASASAAVAFGDSITDGAHSTLDANHRWPNFLATRLLARASGPEVGVVDEGIGGNRLLHDAAQRIPFGVSALARFDRDVLAQPGVRYVIILEGINDIGHPGTEAALSESVTADDIIGALRQLAARAHDCGLVVFGATLTPFEGTAHPGYFTPEKEVERKAVNAWIRTTRDLDGVIDFDKATRDPEHPDRMLPAYDSGDHLHPGDQGYRAMADAVDLSLFR